MAIGKEALGAPSRPHRPSALERFVKSRTFRFALATGAMSAGGYESYHNVPVVRQTIDSLEASVASHWNSLQQTRAENQALSQRSLGPQQGEIANWWQELPEEQIKSLATLPDINQIGEKYLSTVSPALQEKAKQAGYKLIYQGDPNDTVGRTIVTKGREVDAAVDWTSEDLGFGRAGIHVRGILKAWVPDPDDPTQMKKVYALLEDPTAKKQYVIAVDLSQFDPNKNTNLELPTFFAVDNLEYGPEYIRDKTKAAGRGGILGYQVPDPGEDRSSKKWPWKGIIVDFPEFYQLLRVKGYNLSDLAKPGDYVSTTQNWIGANNNQHILFKDEKNIGVAGEFIVRRFGGLKQWQSELNHTTP